MTKVRVAIADDNKDIIDGMVAYFQSHPHIEIVATASNGHTCIKMIEEHKPDIVLLDNVMPHLDGLAVLEQVSKYEQEQRTNLQIIMCTAFARDEIMQQAAHHGAAYFISKPFAFDQVESKILACVKEGKRPDLSIEQQVTAILIRLGIPSHLKGYTYLNEAIQCVYQDRHTLNSIMGEVYLPIAMRYEVTEQSVERAIRSVIKKVWEQDPLPTDICELFSVACKKPSNSSFIGTIVDKYAWQ
ncbi:hypothetical protein CH76_08110 [Lysinibacillus sp. BF-4]|uniref:sporulation transcription factor Spo0A n=1 Tax=Lysinibacillus sp. BF-4 TaxID=1473546 RepID=UPI000502ED62|nr:sporulation transcription factor Spo0A [Lysinibacillus sp. BF-4]KFL43184.1 hypothetical protein CH76_08110 [Lysinibacillus sp. BF-4]